MGGRSGKVRERFTTIEGPRNTAHRYVHRLMMGTATLGTVRMEWHNAMSAMVIPTNFSSSRNTPIGFRVDDAQNLIVEAALQGGFEWVLFVEDDVMPPADLLLKLRPYMQHARYPIVSGLYYVKGNRKEPMIYRGRGNGPFLKWKPGERVWADGVPTGCLLVHGRIFEALADHAETYTLKAGQPLQVRRFFETPRIAYTDPQGGSRKLLGTSDLYFCDRVRDLKLLAEAGWKALQKKRYPFLVDTSIACGHINRDTGFVFK